MAIIRTRLPFEDQFVQVPNNWVRDKRLSRKARGLLVEIMSHSHGWRITNRSLQEGGPEGREAITTAIRELKDAGYLTIQKQREEGSQKFNGEVDYVITDPWKEPVRAEQRVSRPTDNPSDGESAPKNTSLKEEQEIQELSPPTAAAIAEEDVTFSIAYEHWPKKVDRKDAAKRWPKAVKESGLSATHLAFVVEQHAQAYRDAKTERRFIPSLLVWLNKGRWENELPTPDAPNSTAVRSNVTTRY